MIRKIFYRYTAWYKFDLTKTKAMLVCTDDQGREALTSFVFFSVLVGEYE